MTRIPIFLDERHALALSKLARQEYRDVRQQAAVIIRDELARRGLLAPISDSKLPDKDSRVLPISTY
jgi:hypothetical protein